MFTKEQLNNIKRLCDGIKVKDEQIYKIELVSMHEDVNELDSICKKLKLGLQESQKGHFTIYGKKADLENYIKKYTGMSTSMMKPDNDPDHQMHDSIKAKDSKHFTKDELANIHKLCDSIRTKDSAASNIVKEIKATYPQVHITQSTAVNNKWHVTMLQFENYPGSDASGFGNDPRTKVEEKWLRFLNHLYEKYTGEKADYTVTAKHLRIYEPRQ